MSKIELKESDLKQVSGGKGDESQAFASALEDIINDLKNSLSSISDDTSFKLVILILETEKECLASGLYLSAHDNFSLALANMSIIGINHNEFKTILSDIAQKIVDLSREISKIFKH